jgi:hypothetical protein
MTLARTALRLVTAACLKGSADARPTIAEGRVYDSRVSELAPEAFVDDAKAIVILLTDVDEGSALSDQNGGPPFHRLIDVVLEMGMTQAIKDEDGYVIGYPDTDARLEASLDMLQFQVLRRLAYDDDPLPLLFRRFVRIRKQESHRQVLDESGVKVACRILTLTCEINDDRVNIVNPASSSSPNPDGLDVLPDPLRSVARALPEDSPGRGVCVALAGAMAQQTAEPFRGLDIEITNPNDAPTIQAAIELPQDTPED